MAMAESDEGNQGRVEWKGLLDRTVELNHWKDISEFTVVRPGGMGSRCIIIYPVCKHEGKGGRTNERTKGIGSSRSHGKLWEGFAVFWLMFII